MEKVLILLSTYNGTKYIREQIDSIINQQGILPRLLVRDDGSSDNTIDILQEYKKEYSWLFEDVIIGKNVGSTASFCELMKLAFEVYGNQYEYYAFADQDDSWARPAPAGSRLPP